MKLGSAPKTVLLTALGVFIAGVAMNALRDNDFVKNAISGFDA
tara:strand:- start:8139 stop:8267 length:129 start_codon:yes stop_codon:yes gene_type:complete